MEISSQPISDPEFWTLLMRPDVELIRAMMIGENNVLVAIQNNGSWWRITNNVTVEGSSLVVGGDTNSKKLVVPNGEEPIPRMLQQEVKIFHSCGCMLLVWRDDIGSNDFTIYEIMEGSSAWSVRFLVNTQQLMHPLPEGWSIRTSVWSICLGEVEEDAFVVMKISGKVIKYNLISKTNHELLDIGSSQSGAEVVNSIPYFEFIPSLASV